MWRYNVLYNLSTRKVSRIVLTNYSSSHLYHWHIPLKQPRTYWHTSKTTVMNITLCSSICSLVNFLALMVQLVNTIQKLFPSQTMLTHSTWNNLISDSLVWLLHFVQMFDNRIGRHDSFAKDQGAFHSSDCQESDLGAVKDERRPAAWAGRISPNDIALVDLSLKMPTCPSVSMDPNFKVLSPNLLPT